MGIKIFLLHLQNRTCQERKKEGKFMVQVLIIYFS